MEGHIEVLVLLDNLQQIIRLCCTLFQHDICDKQKLSSSWLTRLAKVSSFGESLQK